MENSGHWSRNRLDSRMEEWRARRVQKMASRLQLHSDRPRTISASVLGYGNQGKVTLQPDPKCNRTERQWNTNYSNSGFRAHSAAHQQYEPDYQAGHHRGHSSFHRNGQKRVHFSSHKALHKERKSTSMPYRKFSSCSNVSNLREEETMQVSFLNEQPNNKASGESSATPSLELVSHLIVDPGEDKVSSSSADIVNSSATPYQGLVDKNINFNATEDVDKVETSVSLNNTFTITVESEFIFGSSELPDQNFEDCLPDSNGNEVACSSVNEEKSSITLNAGVVKLSDSLCYDPKSAVCDSECSLVISIPNVSDDSVVVPIENIENKTIPAVEHDSPKVDNLSDSQLYIDSGSDVANSNELELSFSYEPDVEVIEEDSSFVLCDDYSVPDHSSEVAVESVPYLETVEENEEHNSETSGNENAVVVPVTLIVTCDKGSSKVVGEKHNMDKEIENVENKFANISITHKDDLCSDNDCCMTTPMKRERKKALLDATNILPSSTIKYTVREIRKKDESEIIVTPVRRSLRMSSITPISRKNEVHTLEELSPEIRGKMKLKPNPAIDI